MYKSIVRIGGYIFSYATGHGYFLNNINVTWDIMNDQNPKGYRPDIMEIEVR